MSSDVIATERLSGIDAPICAVVFQRIWQSALVLVVGAILAPGKRTVSAILRVMGLHEQPHFQNYHRVLSRAVVIFPQKSGHSRRVDNRGECSDDAKTTQDIHRRAES